MNALKMALAPAVVVALTAACGGGGDAPDSSMDDYQRMGDTASEMERFTDECTSMIAHWVETDLAGVVLGDYDGRLLDCAYDADVLAAEFADLSETATVDWISESAGLTAEGLVFMGDAYELMVANEYELAGVAFDRAGPLLQDAADVLRAHV